MRNSGSWTPIVLCLLLASSIASVADAQATNDSPSRGLASDAVPHPEAGPAGILRLLDTELSRAPITVVLTDDLRFPEAEALVMRYSTGSDIIFLKEGKADPGRLAAAIASLFWHRRNHGTTVERDATIEVRADAGPSTWVVVVPILQERLEELREAPLAPILQHGLLRAIQIRGIG